MGNLQEILVHWRAGKEILASSSLSSVSDFLESKTYEKNESSDFFSDIST